MTHAPAPFRTFADLLAHLDGLGMFHMDLGLGRMEAALANLGLSRPRFRAVQVVGTNGKGSTSLYLAEAARAHGLRVGLYSSPHFVSPRERVLVDGRMLDEASWTRLGNEVLAASRERGLTYFEFVTVLAALAFERAGADLAVLEAGLGGRHDATRALPADLVVVTPVGLDHVGVLGDTLGAIARDKAGALRPGGPALSALQHPEADAALRAEALAVGARLLSLADAPGFVPRGLRPGMIGPHQHDNARLALAAWRLLAREAGWPVDDAACARAAAGAQLAGRMQRVPGDSELILDGAHNPHALAALALALEAEGLRPACVAFGCMRDKDLATMVPMVAALTDGPLLAVGLPDLERAMPAPDLATALGPRARAVADAAALAASLDDIPGPLLVCGSLYLLGEFFAARPDCLPARGPDVSL